MPINLVSVIDQALLDDALKRQALVVFGDNAAGYGRGGQAKHARGHPAAVGIPTKRSPYAFFSDADFDSYAVVSAPRWRLLATHIQDGGFVFWPEAGIGTGRAQLAQRAPRIWRHVQRCTARLHELSDLYEGMLAAP